MPMVPRKKLNFWIENNLNVLFVGTHGIGKTSIVEEAFNKHGIKWRYFSAATMDPWVDFIGVPKEKVNEDGQSYLDLIRPIEFQNDEVEYIFFDEYNRAAPKVRNAVMELIQFKSINGRKFENLRAIWAAINPYDEEETYDVDQLDPAQEDRFHVIYNLPSKPDSTYFNSTFGPSMGAKAIEWWGMLPSEKQKLVSPRRLDYAVDIYMKGGDLRDVLCKEVRPLTLKRFLERVDGEIQTHTERWVEDSEQYIREITKRGSKIDAVDAFSELTDVSLDQAVAYIDRLLPSQLEDLASNDKTVMLLLRSLEDAKVPNRKVKTALTKNKMAEEQVTALLSNYISVCKETNRHLFDAIIECGKEPNKTKSWKILEKVVEVQASSDKISFDECVIVAICCAERLKGVSRASAYRGSNLATSVIKDMKVVLQYVTTKFPNNVSEFVSIVPETLVMIFSAE